MIRSVLVGTADDNKGLGALVYNEGGAGNITLHGTNSFSGNEAYGIQAISNANITLENITANNNKNANGAYVYTLGTTGDITLSGTNAFYGNGGYGLDARSKGNITLNGTNLFYENAGGYGLWAVTDGMITVNNSEVYNQWFGLYIDGNYPITVRSSNIHDNTTGIKAPCNKLVLEDMTFSNNITDFTTCYQASLEKSSNETAYQSLPVNEVFVMDGAVDLECELYQGARLSLPNGNWIYFPCPIEGNISLGALDANSLPRELPQESTFHSGLTTAVTLGGAAVDPLPAYATLSLAIPEGLDPASLAILFWNGAEWIGQSGFVSADGMYYQATVNFSGDFVLVSK